MIKKVTESLKKFGLDDSCETIIAVRFFETDPGIFLNSVCEAVDGCVAEFALSDIIDGSAFLISADLQKITKLYKIDDASLDSSQICLERMEGQCIGIIASKNI